MSDSAPPSGNDYWIKFAVCCLWIGLAVAAKMVDLDGLNIQIRFIGALRLTTVAIEVTSPIALIWLFILAKEAK